MALSRAYLKSLGLEEDKIASVIEAHSETVNGLTGKYADLENKFNELTKRYDGLKAEAEKLPGLREELAGVRKELDAMKKENYKGRYEELFSSVEKGKARAAKEAAVKAYYEGKNIRGGNLAIAMRGTDLESITLDEKGKLTDTGPLDELVEGDFKTLIRSEPQTRRTIASGGSLAGGTPPEPSASSVMNSLIRGH